MSESLPPELPAVVARLLTIEVATERTVAMEMLRGELVNAAVRATGCDPAQARRSLSRHVRADPRPEGVVLGELVFLHRIEQACPGVRP